MTVSQARTQEISLGDYGRPRVKVLERDSFTEYWLTVLPRADAAPEEAVQELFGSVAGILSSYGIQPIQEKIYGNVSNFAEIKEIRQSAYHKSGLADDLPATTYISGVPVRQGGLAGIQIWGIKAKQSGLVRVETVKRDKLLSGRSVSGPGFQMLYLPSVQGWLPDGKLPHTVTEQAERMFLNAEASLEAGGMTFLDVARTWIYLARILQWYDEFNRVRNGFFKLRGVGDASAGHAFPASTGIQGRSAGEECLLDVLAVKTDGSETKFVRPLLHSCRQDLAFKYGSAFSRGMSISLEGSQTIHVSGTASIGPDGQTRYLNTVEAQIMETLLSIAALLASAGGGLRDITSSTLFCKDASYYGVFREMTGLLGVPDFPMVPVVADVCRSDLLVEIEAVAAVSGSGHKAFPEKNSSAGGNLA